MKLFKKMIGLSFILTFALAVSACSTMEGLGEDIEDAGESVQDAAQ
ncbi:entericidin A/B family lipoprotein [Thalassotalea piscium]|uniref:Putative small secreted protein n=1 Tax=Thalassotalea piscium TaxID=1230533 RepID=A0A7X0TUQ1_9GAMM|nr:entericidin A/B family lipoprotein [Thalassotalea piscium]MBB6544379.1 putative small secreted protein [Thalassotalea piscium]